MPTFLHLDELLLEEYALEEYALRERVTAQETVYVEKHLAGCPMCRERLEEIKEFIAFMRSIPAETKGHMHRHHDTDAGTIFLVVSGSDASRWEARVIGGGYDIVRSFVRGPQAKSWLDRWFDETLGTHHCERACAPGWK